MRRYCWNLLQSFVPIEKNENSYTIKIVDFCLIMGYLIIVTQVTVMEVAINEILQPGKRNKIAPNAL